MASVAYFVKHIAMDVYARSIKFERIKQFDPEKQPIFPLKYYDRLRFTEFLQLFGEEYDLKHVALFGYFAGLRIFEIMKMKRKDIRSMEEDIGLTILVFGKGSKHRTTYIMDKHVVEYINSWIENNKYKPNDYLFMNKFWSKKVCKSIDEESFRAQRLGHYIGTLIKEKTKYPSHSLRRAFATHLCKIGCENATIQT